MKKKNKALKNTMSFLVFAGPAVLVFFAVILVAFFNGIQLTFTDWNGLSDSYQYIGLTNYANALSDTAFWDSLGRTFKYVVCVVAFTNIIAFLIAFFLTRGYKGQGIFRVAFFTPNLIGGVVLGIVWKFVFSQVFTQIGSKYGMALFKNNWLSTPDSAFIALVVVAVWQLAGYLMLIYMAGIISLPKEVQEAARLDGAVGWKNIRHIVIPLIMPSVTIAVFMSIKTAFMAYDVNLALTNGGPFQSTELVAMRVYNEAFQAENYGVGQTEALILFAIVAVISIIQVILTKSKEVEA
ncbi:MAG TPA: sugar ABC transporter permease [Candidatus Limivivens merdigallinarum]|uniref:Sugar ABC transporter permease n=1 Tax=Candidatus Limivivens merdigallinarum TaxID=2840859 RepID=A0A9D1D033_9FIRM|nr:sugar ABC transporter permease [Candidatus Limivivens merdigallinarum]